MSVRGLTAVAVALTSLILGACHKQETADQSVFSCEKFTVYADRVVEDGYVAKAISSGEIVSTYARADTARRSAAVNFRFCINGRDNELPAGVWHTAVAVPGDSSSIIRFGDVDSRGDDVSDAGLLPRGARWTVRLDMRPVLDAFARDGYYVTPRSDTIFQRHFKGVWLAGERAPMTVDFAALHSRGDLKLKNRGDSIYELTVELDTLAAMVRGGRVSTDSLPSDMPAFTSGQMLVDATYNISVSRLKELAVALRRSKVRLSTTAVSHAVYLSLAMLDPETSKVLLRRCVSHGRVMQDAGHGGGWPVSADRLMWIPAAYEVYKATGDEAWLREVYEVAVKTLGDDRHVLLNQKVGLMRGAVSNVSSGLRFCPRWFSPRDVFESMSLTVNVQYAAALSVTAEVARILCGEPPEYMAGFDDVADRINTNLWIPNLGYYSAFLYNVPYTLQANVTDNLGQSLALLFSVARPEMGAALMRRTPRSWYGTAVACPVPTAEFDGSYSNVVLPYVQAYWNIAAAHSGNLKALRAGVGAMYRAFAFGCGSGAVDATTGCPVVMPDDDCFRLLGNAAYAAMNLRLFAGATLDSAGVSFRPFIPPAMGGERHVSGLRYREAVLDIFISGTGNKVLSMSLDGENVASGRLPADLKGSHTVKIVMANNSFPPVDAVIAEPTVMPTAPRVEWRGVHQAEIADFDDAGKVYAVVNGVIQEELSRADYSLRAYARSYTAVDFLPVSDSRCMGFGQPSHKIIPRGAMLKVNAAQLGETGTMLPVPDEDSAGRFIEFSPARNLHVEFVLRSPDDSDYLMDVRYANGSGEEDAQSRCVIRSVSVDGRFAGAVVMPCLGEGDWCATSFSSVVPMRLHRGLNRVSIDFTAPYDFNGARSPGTALIEYVRLIKM